MSRATWIRWLVVVLAYSLLLVAAGSVAGLLFSMLGFGPPDAIDTDEVRSYLRLPYMVLGAVLGYPTHALFNASFGVALAFPLLKLSCRSTTGGR